MTECLGIHCENQITDFDLAKDIRIGSNPFLRPYPHTILLSTLGCALIEKTSLSMHSSDFVVNLQKTLL